MVKKMKSSDKETAGSQAEAGHDSPLAGSVKESAQQIWLAGMGAFSKAQEEGTKVFEALVKEGLNLQKKTQGIAEDKLGEVSGKLSAMAETVTAKTGQNWDKLEAIFEARTAKAMAKLGVPTAKDVAALMVRIDEISAQVAQLSKGSAAAKTSKTAKAAAPVKAAAKAMKAVKAVVAQAAAPAKKAPARKAPAKPARRTAA